MRARAWRVAVFASVLGGWAHVASGEPPALTRVVFPERYVTGREEMDKVRAQRSASLVLTGGMAARSDGGGEASPFDEVDRGAAGRADLSATLGRFTLGGELIGDSRRHVEPREFPARLYGRAYVPEGRATFTLAAGFGERDQGGASAAAEVLLARWTIVRTRAELPLRVMGWGRALAPEGDGTTVLTSGVGAILRHVPVFGSQPYVAASLLNDAADGVAPSSQALIQLGWGSVARPLGARGDPDSPTAPEPSDVNGEFLLALGYAAPLDDRTPGRFVIQAGMRFLKPIGG